MNDNRACTCFSTYLLTVRCTNGLIQNAKSGSIICVIHDTKSFIQFLYTNSLLISVQCQRMKIRLIGMVSWGLDKQWSHASADIYTHHITCCVPVNPLCHTFLSTSTPYTMMQESLFYDSNCAPLPWPTPVMAHPCHPLFHGRGFWSSERSKLTLSPFSRLH